MAFKKTPQAIKCLTRRIKQTLITSEHPTILALSGQHGCDELVIGPGMAAGEAVFRPERGAQCQDREVDLHFGVREFEMALRKSMKI